MPEKDEAEEDVSWRLIDAGMPVRASDETLVGHVTHVLGDSDGDIFDGVGFRKGLFGSHRMAPFSMIARITNRAVYLKVTADQADACPSYQEEHVYRVGTTGFFRHRQGWRDADRR